MPGASMTHVHPRIRRRVRPVFRASILGAVVLGAGTSFLATSRLVGLKEREVVAEKLYRSAQPDVSELDDLIERRHLACVLSLRKADPPAPEVLVETEHLRERGILHANVALSPTRLPRPEALVDLVSRFDRGPYPMLVHCEEGVDRTGFAIVVWLVLYGGKSVDEARASDLSLWNGHVSFGQAHAMDDFFDLYARTGQGLGLRAWMLEVYPSIYGTGKRERRQGEVLAHDHP